MGHSSSKPDPSLESLRVLLRSRGLELSDSQAIKTWETLVKVAPWLPASNLFDWETWDRVEQLVSKAQVNQGDIPPLGAFPTLAALKSCFPPWPSKPAAKNLIDRETTGLGAPSRGDSDPHPQAESTLAGQESHKEPDENCGMASSTLLMPSPGLPNPRLLCTHHFLVLVPLLTLSNHHQPPLLHTNEQGFQLLSHIKTHALPLAANPKRIHLFHPQLNPGPCQLFPVNVNPGGNRPAPWYPWEPGDLKELKKAVLEDGPNAPWTETILQGLSHHPCTTADWRALAQAVLPGPLYIKWCALYKEECQQQAERNLTYSCTYIWMILSWGPLVPTN